MRKVGLLIASLALVGSMFAMVPAQAANCTATSYNSPGNCDIAVSVTVPLAATLTFTSVNSNLGTVLPGVTFNQTTGNGIAGTYHSNGGTATLAVTCSAVVTPAFTSGSSSYRVSWDGAAFANISQSQTLSSCTSSLGSASGKIRTAVGGTTASFEDLYGVVVNANEASGTHTITLNYSISVA